MRSESHQAHHRCSISGVFYSFNIQVYLPGDGLSTLQLVSYLMFVPTLHGKYRYYYFPHSTNVQTEAPFGYVPCQVEGTANSRLKAGSQEGAGKRAEVRGQSMAGDRGEERRGVLPGPGSDLPSTRIPAATGWGPQPGRDFSLQENKNTPTLPAALPVGSEYSQPQRERD